MKNVYFISGLGADNRSFKFLDLSFCNPQFIDWLVPDKSDTLPSYAERLFEKINDENATIVGISFGGMLAMEIAKKHPNTKVIIISSAKTYREIPVYLRMWKHLPVYKFHSNRLKNNFGPLVLNILGAQGQEQKKLQLLILKDSDPLFMRWAMDVIVKWNNILVPKNVVHIHGTADRLLPYRFVKADYTIYGGGHVMMMDKHEEISGLLKELIVR